MDGTDIVKVIGKCFAVTSFYGNVSVWACSEPDAQTKWNNDSKFAIMDKLRLKGLQVNLLTLIHCGGIKIHPANSTEHKNVESGSPIVSVSTCKEIICSRNTDLCGVGLE